MDFTIVVVVWIIGYLFTAAHARHLQTKLDIAREESQVRKQEIMARTAERAAEAHARQVAALETVIEECLPKE